MVPVVVVVYVGGDDDDNDGDVFKVEHTNLQETLRVVESVSL